MLGGHSLAYDASALLLFLFPPKLVTMLEGGDGRTVFLQHIAMKLTSDRPTLQQA
jgi:hypothetical protein